MKQRRCIKKVLTFVFLYQFWSFGLQFENYDLPLEDTLYQCHKRVCMFQKNIANS